MRARVNTIDRRTNDHSGTRSLTAVVPDEDDESGGERYTRDVNADGVIEGPKEFIKYLIASDAHAVEAIEDSRDSSDAGGDGDGEDRAKDGENADDEPLESGADEDDSDDE
jgi:hypothetical protein